MEQQEKDSTRHQLMLKTKANQKLKFKILRRLKIISPTWTAKEEVSLLYCLEMYGVCNWSTISKKLQQYDVFKSENDIEEHYLTCYMQTLDCLPAMLHQRPTQKPQTNITIQTDKPSIAPTHHSSFLPFDIFKHHNIDPSLLGLPNRLFQPKRHYIRPYIEQQLIDPDAEQLITDLEIQDKETKQQINKKMKIMDEYNKRLTQRYAVMDKITKIKTGFKRLQRVLRAKDEFQVFRQYLRLGLFMQFDQFTELICKLSLLKKVRSLMAALKKVRRVLKQTEVQQLKWEAIRGCFQNLRKDKPTDPPQETEERLLQLLTQLIGVDSLESQRLLKLSKDWNEDEAKQFYMQFKADEAN